MLLWLDNNIEKVQHAQKIAQKINDLNIINSHRRLPFEIVPADDNYSEFNLTVFMDHPKFGSWDLSISDNGVLIKNLDKPEESYDLKSFNEIYDFIDTYNDDDLKSYSEFQELVSARIYQKINKMINDELKKYHEIIDPQFKSIKKILSSTENVGLTNPSDGTVSYLNRVMGRWDLALLWSPCPFVVVSNPEETEKIQNLIYDFKILEQEACQVVNTMQKLCALSNMDVEIVTDSSEKEIDASGWVSLDELGIPKIGPLLHAVKINVYSTLEGNLRKNQSKGKLIV